MIKFQIIVKGILTNEPKIEFLTRLVAKRVAKSDPETNISGLGLSRHFNHDPTVLGSRFSNKVNLHVIEYIEKLHNSKYTLYC